MRASIPLALLAACSTACTPPAPPASQAPPDPPTAQSCANPSAAEAARCAANGDANTSSAPANAAFAQLADAPLASGQWFFRADAGVVSAGFGEPQSEFQFVLSCEAPSGKLTVTSVRELSPDQATTLTLITAARSIDLSAHSFNEGMPYIAAELAESAPEHSALIATLRAPQERFGVRVAGETDILPWDESIPRALAPCAS